MLKDGIYDAEARGMAGFVKVKLTVKDQKIVAADLDLSTETPQYGQKAEKQQNRRRSFFQSVSLSAVSVVMRTSSPARSLLSEER